MPMPKIEKPEQVVLMEGEPARKLVKVVKVHKDDPMVERHLVALAEKVKAQGNGP